VRDHILQQVRFPRWTIRKVAKEILFSIDHHKNQREILGRFLNPKLLPLLGTPTEAMQKIDDWVATPVLKRCWQMDPSFSEIFTQC
jgi:hypothetical protein